MQVSITRIDPSLPLPEHATPGSAGFDLYSRMDAVIPPRAQARIPSNLIIKVPQGYVLLIAARSSLAHKKGLVLRNGIGVIDQDYHGPHDEISIAVYNFTNEPVAVARGERLAQGLMVPVSRMEWQEVDAIDAPSRGGFGSTAGYKA